MIEMCIHNWNWHQLLELWLISASTIGRCINCWNLAENYLNSWYVASTCWNGNWKCINNWNVHQLLECGINIWKVHQMLDLGWRLTSVDSNFDFWHHVDICFCEELMRTHLTRSTHLFALWSMCYLPEWDIVNNNNKYTQNINGDINGMLTLHKPRRSDLTHKH